MYSSVTYSGSDHNTSYMHDLLLKKAFAEARRLNDRLSITGSVRRHGQHMRISNTRTRTTAKDGENSSGFI
jgi:hypothetical protein